VPYQEEKHCFEALEKQKREQEETLAENVRQANKRKEDILTTKISIFKGRRTYNEAEHCRELISEANKKLSKAVNQNNMQSAEVAQIMLSSGNDHLTHALKQVEDIHSRSEKEIGTSVKRIQRTNMMLDMLQRRRNNL